VHARGLSALETKITSANLQNWIGKLESREVNVQLPKFKLETDYKMGESKDGMPKGLLPAMGMVRAFTDPRDPVTGAQFDGMCASSDPMLKLYITKVLHKAFVEVSEKGTEAAAATAVVMAVPVMASMDTPFTPTFRADKPFLFAIRDVKTGSILFLGRMVDPGK
jgi:serpin B